MLGLRVLRRPLRLWNPLAPARFNTGADDSPRATPAASEGWWNSFALLHDAEPVGRGPYAQRLVTFENWLKARGARFDDLALQLSPASGTSRGQGCAGFAKRPLEVGDAVVDLPVDGCLLTATAAKKSAVGQIAATSGVDEHDGNLFLAVTLLELWTQQRAQPEGLPSFVSTDFGPYLDILPRRLPHVPLFWDNDDLALLEGSPLRDAVEVRRACVATDFAKLQAEAQRYLEALAQGHESTTALEPSPKQKQHDIQHHGNATKKGRRSVCAGDSKSVERAARALLAASTADYAIAEATVCSRAFLVSPSSFFCFSRLQFSPLHGCTCCKKN